MDEKLRELADRLGIATAYTDCGLKAACHEVSDETVRFFAGVLGYKAGSGEEIARSLRALDNRRWQTALEPVYVIPRSRKVFDVVVPENEIEGDFGLSVVSRQTGEKSEVSFVVVTLPERRTVGKKTYGRLEIEITSDLAVGYYDAELNVGENSYRTLLAVAGRLGQNAPVGLLRAALFSPQPPQLGDRRLYRPVQFCRYVPEKRRRHYRPQSGQRAWPLFSRGGQSLFFGQPPVFESDLYRC